MNRINILVYCADKDMLTHMLAFIHRQEGWHAVGADTDEQAIELFMRHKYDLVILGGVPDPIIDAKLKTIFQKQDRHVSILNFYGGDDWFLGIQVRTILKLDEEKPIVHDGF